MRVVVAGELQRESHNAPLHLFSASKELIGFGGSAYRQHSEHTSLLLRQLFEKTQGEGLVMAFTMEDFTRQYVKEHFSQLTPEEQDELLKQLPLETRLAGLPADQIQKYLDQATGGRRARPSKPRRKK